MKLRCALIGLVAPIFLANCSTTDDKPQSIPAISATLERQLKADGLDDVLERARGGNACAFAELAGPFNAYDLDEETREAYLSYAANRGDGASRALLSREHALKALDRNLGFVKAHRLSGSRPRILNALRESAGNNAQLRDIEIAKTYHGFNRTAHKVGPATIIIIGDDADLKVVSITMLADLSTEKYAAWESGLVTAALQAAEPERKIVWDKPWRGPHPAGPVFGPVRFSEEQGTTYGFANGSLMQGFTLSVDPSFDSFQPGYGALEPRAQKQLPKPN
jgi:hypothetical protein